MCLFEEMEITFSTEIPTLNSRFLRNFLAQMQTRHLGYLPCVKCLRKLCLFWSVLTAQLAWYGMFEFEHICVQADIFGANLLVQVSYISKVCAEKKVRTERQDYTFLGSQ